MQTQAIARQSNFSYGYALNLHVECDISFVLHIALSLLLIRDVQLNYLMQILYKLLILNIDKSLNLDLTYFFQSEILIFRELS